MTTKHWQQYLSVERHELPNGNIYMKKNLGVVQEVYPMPVLMVAAYDENGEVKDSNVFEKNVTDAVRVEKKIRF